MIKWKRIKHFRKTVEDGGMAEEDVGGGFWAAWFWLPAGVTGADLDTFEAEGRQISRAKDLLIVPVLAALVLLVRFAFEATIGKMAAGFFNIKVTKFVILPLGTS